MNNPGGSNPIFAHGKMCVFPFFPMRKNGEKSIWKEREMNTFPFLSIYFFSHFSPWGKIGISIGKNKEYKKEKIFSVDVLKTIHKNISNQKNTHFSMGKNGVGPPNPANVIEVLSVCYIN